MAEAGKGRHARPWFGRRSGQIAIFLYDPPVTQIPVDEKTIRPAGNTRTLTARRRARAR